MWKKQMNLTIPQFQPTHSNFRTDIQEKPFVERFHSLDLLPYSETTHQGFKDKNVSNQIKNIYQDAESNNEALKDFVFVESHSRTLDVKALDITLRTLEIVAVVIPHFTKVVSDCHSFQIVPLSNITFFNMDATKEILGNAPRTSFRSIFKNYTEATGKKSDKELWSGNPKVIHVPELLFSEEGDENIMLRSLNISEQINLYLDELYARYRENVIRAFYDF